MSPSEFWDVMFSVFVPIIAGLTYVVLRGLEKGFYSYFSYINYELRNLKENPEYLEKLQTRTWMANYHAVAITASVFVTVISVIIGYLHSQRGLKQNDYFPYFRNILLIFVSLGMILSGLSMQFWMVCLDQNRSVETYIRARKLATILNLLSWFCVYIAVFMLIGLVDSGVSFVVSTIGVVVFTGYQEWRYHIHRKFGR